MSEVHATEEWRRIPGFPAYEVSDRGRVRSYWKRTGWHQKGGMVIGSKAKEIKRGLGPSRVHVSLNDGAGLQKTFGVAMLVLMAFVRLPEPGEVARHMNDPDPWNLNLDNLAWGTSTENAADIVRHRGIHHSATLTAEQVKEARRLLAEGGMTQRAIAKLLGVSEATICNLGQGKVHKFIT